MTKPVEIEDPENLGIREPTTLNMRIHKWSSGTKVRARLKPTDDFQDGQIINQGYVNGRWIGGYLVRFDVTGDKKIIPYEHGVLIEKK